MTTQPDDGQNEPDPDFIKSIRAGLGYWQKKTETMQAGQAMWLDGQRFNLNEAVVQGLRYPETWQDTAMLLLQTFDFSEWRGYWYEWTAVFEQALAAAPEKETEVYGRMQNRLGQLYRLGNRLPEAEAQHQAALALAQQLVNDDLLAITYGCLAEYHEAQRDVGQTRTFAQAALDLAQIRPSVGRIAAFAHRILGSIDEFVGNWPAAIEHYQQAIQIWRKLNNHVYLARTLYDLGSVYATTNKFDLAQQAYEEAGAILSPTNNVKDKAFVSLNLGVLYYRQKDWARAEAAFLQIDPMALREQNELDLLGKFYNNLGNVYLEMKRWDSAANYLALAIALFRERENALDLGNSLGTLASVYGQDGQQEAALPLYAEAIQLLLQFPESQWAQKLLREFGAADEKLREALSKDTDKK
ncbi:MAG: tetratricopeptide repeat protein [Ardenticatenaceae bacterium]|nr:tetratricopeptide repeat protein [Ardenticatenaceae bacterium]